MKKLTYSLLILGLALITLDVCLSKSHKKSHKHSQTPKGIELRNHFGAPNVGSPYGASTSYDDYVQSNPEVFTPQRYQGWKNIENARKFKPYPGWEQKLNPHHIKSGDFTNVAPSAEKIVNPEITGPKLQVQGEIEYPSHVKVPSFYGYKREYQNVAAYDREDGKIIEDKVIVTKPVYGWEDKVSRVIKIG